MLHHAHGNADVLAQLLALRTADQTVHGILIAAVIGLVFGFTVFALRRGLGSTAALAGLVAYALGSVPVIGAAMIDGFVVPALAARYANGSESAVTGAMQLITLCAIAIQVCTKVWLVATSAAVVIWSMDLVRAAGVKRAIGILGFVAGVLVVVVTAITGNVSAHTLGIVVLLQTLWNVAIGVLMMRGDV